MSKIKVLLLLPILTIAAFSPAFGLSEEAKALLERLKTKTETSATVLPSTQEAEQSFSTQPKAEAVITLPNARVKRGMPKTEVFKILGSPIHDGDYYLKYGLNEAIYINKDLVVDWVGFPANSDKFEHPGSPNGVIKSGCSKDIVLRVMGQPLNEYKEGKSDALRYHQVTVFLDKGKVTNWAGFVDDDPRFDKASNKAYINTNTTSKTTPKASSSRPRLSNGNYTTYTGPRGGTYHYSASGKKVYHKRR